MKIRAVLDTNIYASALMNPSSNPGKVLKKILNDPDYEIVVSEPILSELRRVLFYPKVRKNINATDEDINHWIEAITIVAHVVTPLFDYDVLVEDDPDDDKFIIAAIEGVAKYIVSGDIHLLQLKNYQNIMILTSKEFLANV